MISSPGSFPLYLLMVLVVTVTLSTQVYFWTSSLGLYCSAPTVSLLVGCISPRSTVLAGENWWFLNRGWYPASFNLGNLPSELGKNVLLFWIPSTLRIILSYQTLTLALVWQLLMTTAKQLQLINCQMEVESLKNRVQVRQRSEDNCYTRICKIAKQNMQEIQETLTGL